jgi:hypothetical protein
MESTESLILQNTENSAELYRQELERLCLQVGIDLPSLAKNDVLCCDVGGGIEISTFTKYHLNLFIVTESTTQHPQREKIDLSLSFLLKKCPNTKLVYGNTPEVLNYKLLEQRYSVITWLNIFPEKVTFNAVSSFINKAHKLLKPGGIIILSCDKIKETEEFGSGLYRGAYRTFRAFCYQIIDLDKPTL